MEGPNWHELEARISALEVMVAELFRMNYQTGKVSEDTIGQSNMQMHAVVKRWRPESAKGEVEGLFLRLLETIKDYRKFYKKGWGDSW